jgi:hypothetical protein
MSNWMCHDTIMTGQDRIVLFPSTSPLPFPSLPFFFGRSELRSAARPQNKKNELKQTTKKNKKNDDESITPECARA